MDTPTPVAAPVPQEVPEPEFHSEYVDYFGEKEPYRVYLPDGKQFVLCKPMNEGARCVYQKAVNRDVRVDQRVQQAIIKMPSGEERRELLKAVIVGWELVRRQPDGSWAPVVFNTKNLADFLKAAPPEVIDHIEKEIRKHEPWIAAEGATKEQVKEAIAELEEQLARMEAEEEGNVG